MVWILGRTYCTGTAEDYKAVHALQDKYTLVPLSAYGKDYTPPKGKVDPNIDMKTPVREQVNKMDAGAYFKLLASLMKDNPPAKEDAAMVAKMAKIGIVPGKDFDIGKLDPAVAKGLESAPKAGLEKIMAHFKVGGKDVNGWVFTRTRPASTAPTTSSGPPSPTSGWAPTAPRMRFIRPPKWTPTASRTTAPTSTRSLPQGPDAAGRWLLVADHVRRRVFLRRERTEPLHPEQERNKLIVARCDLAK